MTLVVGTGCIAAPGVGPTALRAALEAAGRAPGRTVPIADPDPADRLRMRGLRPLSRASKLGCVAAAAALGEPRPVSAPERQAVVVGTQWGSIEPLVEFDRTAARDGPALVNPAHFPNVVANVHAGYLGILFGLAGPNVTLCGAGAGLEAIGLGADLIRAGRADHALAGGLEALGETVLHGLERAGELDAGPPQGEGAGFVLLARESDPGAGGLARIAGWASRTAYEPGARGSARSTAVGEALAAAGLQPEDVRAAWCGGEHPAESVPASCDVRSVRPVTGDCRAADGALAAVMAVTEVEATGSAVLVLAFPPLGTQTALVLTPARGSSRL